MAEGLWDWQDDDVSRLRREGKQSLARCWSDFDLDGPALKEAAELAHEDNEPVWEMFYLHWFVQQGLFRDNLNLQDLQPAVERLAALAETPACQACPQRFCARESVANFQLAADPPGYAPEILRMSRGMASQVPPGLECAGCFDLLEVGALREMKQLDGAAAVLDRIEPDLSDDNLLFLVSLQRAAIALDHGGPAAMEIHLAQARALLEDGRDVNPDNRWFLLELEVRQSIARGDLAHAEALHRQSATPPPRTSAEAMRIDLALAEAHAVQGAWQDSRRHAERALENARTRGMVRYAAEGALLVGEACKQTGDLQGRRLCAAELQLLLPQLESHDLDQRARDLGEPA